jgi:transposase-like protein
VDWKRIRAEYIAGGTSYRKLAEKHGVSFVTLSKVAKREGWSDLRRQQEYKQTTKTVEAISSKEAKKAVDLFDIADLLADKVREVAMTVSDPDSIKKLTSAIKDIKDIKGIKSEDDIAEQRARIEKLRREAEGDSQDNEIKVIIEGDLEKYSK